jgi:hypothetical protein
LGLCGRGGTDEDWPEEVCGKTQEEKDDLMPVRTSYPDGSLVPLKKWKGKHLVATRCSNTDSVVEFLYVPFIIEDVADPIEDDTDAPGEAVEKEEEEDAPDEVKVNDRNAHDDDNEEDEL